MEAASSPGALQKLLQCLRTETEPRKLYQTLKNLSSLPKLCDTLAEINFQQTIKLLRNQQLLVPFAKDLAACLSERPHFGPQPEPDLQNFACELNLMTQPPRNCPQDKPRESASKEHRQDGTEVFKVSRSSKHSSPGPSQCRSPSHTRAPRPCLNPSPGWRSRPRLRQRQSPSTSPSPNESQSQSQRLRPSPRLRSTPRPCPSPSTQTSPERRVNPNTGLEPRGRKRPRVSLGEPQLPAQNQGQVSKTPGSTEEPWPLQAAKPVTSKSDAGGKTPGHCIQEEHQDGSLETCLNSDSSLSSALRLQLTRCKSGGKSTWKAEALRPGTKVPRGKSDICQDQNGHGVDGHPIAEDASSLQAGVPLSGQEQSSNDTEEEDPPWARRTHFKTPVYSGPAPARLLQKSQKGCLPKPLDCPLPTGCQGTAEETEPWQQEKSSPKTHIGKPTHTQTESDTILQLQESSELRLQTLRARLQGKQAMKPQGRQTKMIAFQAQATSPGQQAESRPGGAASPKMSRLQEAPAHGLPQSATCPQSRVSTKPKKPAPLMAKAIRLYKKRLAHR
ncbi:elongin-A3 member D-like [Peromyscus californicus insignis]|uniref:elongin-A3 member D-like n=1 Tax=Peromyscus californicus insignis TaxID=564181 RepID=UPI0022A6AB15|nr:elongin-A3 member D-like [Peromyscus californicus insignis]